MGRDESDADPRIGTVLDERYRILQKIGDGAMGAVYRGERVKLGRVVAIKFLRNAFADDPSWVVRFEREAKAMSRLEHPHCVSVIDFGVAETPYIVMELVTGQTLRELVDAGPVPVERALHITKQLLGALQHAHDQGIVHRDVKPGNVMLTEATGTGDHVRVLDFGLAKLGDDTAGQSTNSTTSQLVIGTPNYMAPEQSRGKPVDARCDIYATGIVLFELLSGRKPFEAEGTFEVLRKHQEDPLPQLEAPAAEPRLIRALDTVLRRATAKQPEDRFDSATAFAHALDRAVARPETARPRRSMSLFLALLIFVIGGVAGAWYLETQSSAPTAEPAAELARAPSPALTPPPVPVSHDASAVALAPDAAPSLGDAAATVAPPLSLDSGTPSAAAAAVPIDPAAVPIDPAAVPIDPAAVPPIDAGAAATVDTELDQIEAEMAAATASESAAMEIIVDEPAAVETPPSPVAPAIPSARVASIADAQRLIRAGRKDDALTGLVRLRRQNPRLGAIHYLIGNLYFERRWWTNGIDSYRSALRYKSAYRRYRNLNNNVIRALASDRTRRNATSLILRSLGKSAVPFLRRAAKVDRNPKVRKRAAFLAKKLSSPRRR